MQVRLQNQGGALQRQTALRAAQLQMRLRQHRRGGEVPEEQRHKDLESGSLRLLVQNHRAMQHRILLQPQHVQMWTDNVV